ncbi:MAG TPA: glycosyltransferase family 39 protein [Vicinamibacterales bacterium]|nr:glycosyltransferase family 39 protein [Vicinamibacterales bacterium]
MAARARTVLAIVVLAAAGGVLYTRHLAEVPPHLMHDESQFVLQAESIASTGRDLAGRFMPVFFTEPEFPAGRDPAIVYATAAVLKVRPFSESSGRLATALVGVLNIVLMFLLVRALFNSTPLALAAAAMIAFTPAHFIRSRLALSPMYSVPFILLWLWTLVEHERRPTAVRIAVAGAWLGLGLYTYLAGVIMMPLYLGASVCLVGRRHGMSHAGAMLASFTVVLVPMLVWYGTHPERFDQIFGSYREFSTAPAATSVAGIRARAALYWSFFDPAFLFVSGDSSLVNSTRRAGFFPAAFFVLLPVGLYWIAKSGRPILWIIGAGFVLSPLAAVISGAVEMNRLMFAIPFGVLVACVGATMMLGGRRWEQVVALLLLATIPLQFAHFYDDYSNRYRAQAGAWFGGNIGDALVPVIASRPLNAAGGVYISERIPFARRYWRFYALQSGRRDQIDTPEYSLEPPNAAPAGSRWICASAAPDCQALEASTEWRRVYSSGEPGQAGVFDVFVRLPAS